MVHGQSVRTHSLQLRSLLSLPGPPPMNNGMAHLADDSHPPERGYPSPVVVLPQLVPVEPVGGSADLAAAPARCQGLLANLLPGLPGKQLSQILSPQGRRDKSRSQRKCLAGNTLINPGASSAARTQSRPIGPRAPASDRPLPARPPGPSLR